MKLRTMRNWLIGITLAIGIHVVSPAILHAQTGGGGGLGGAGGAGGGGGGGTGFSPTVGGGNTVSASFAGGQASSFSGGVGFSGGAGAAGPGTSTGVGRLGGGGAVLAPTTANPFRTTYINPLSSGLYSIGASTAPGTAGAPGGGAGAATTSTYGQPLYPTTGTAAGGAGLRGGAGALGGAGGIAGGAGFGGGIGGAGGLGAGSGGAGFTTFGVPRAPQYMTTLDENIPRVQHSMPVLNSKLQTMLTSSTNLNRFGPVDVAVDSGTVTLRGSVKTARDRKLVEGMIRLTPGVRDVRNELTIGAR